MGALWGITFFTEADNPLIFTFIASLGFGIMALSLRGHRFLLAGFGAVTLLFWAFIAYLLAITPPMD